jgi:hypothetical protein
MNRTVAQLMDLESLTNWLECQPWYKMYNYQRTGECLLAKYYRTNGFPNARVAINTLSPNGHWFDDWVEIPPEIHVVVYGGPFRLFRTFGGALKRARRLLNKETQAYALQEAGAR